MFSEASFKAGAVGVTAKAELDDCGRVTVEGKLCVGPICAKAKRSSTEGYPETPSDPGIEVKRKIEPQQEPNTTASSEANVKAEAKVGIQSCLHFRW